MEQKDLLALFNNGKLAIKIRANARENRIVKWENNILYLEIAAPAQENKANKEILKVLGKLLKRKVQFVSGLRSREKIIELIQ